MDHAVNAMTGSVLHMTGRHVEAYHCCVVCKLNDGVGVMPGHAVVGEQGVQEGTEHAPLGSSSVEDQHGRCVATHPHHLGAARQEVQDPVAEGGHGQCYCGNCYCAAGWHGDKCELQCDISPWESKRRCTSPDGKICSNRGTCICGECTCYDVDPSGDWGDIHGDTCECDERSCHATYDRYSDDFCSGHGQCNCGRCDCKEGWMGKKCEHPLSCSLSLESSLKKCKGTSNMPCFGRGLCQCGQCACHPPGDTRVHGRTCECDDRQCEDISGEICGGHGFCSCGRCICGDGWFGKLCSFPRTCEMTDAQSKELCETADGVMCNGKGSCHCGRCICSGSPQDWWVSGEYCECDDRECDKHDGLICTGNGMCNCGNCDCWDGWTGNACEIWVGAEY
ncbi:integrin beta-like protein 1 [Salvelinus alpinus]